MPELSALDRFLWKLSPATLSFGPVLFLLGVDAHNPTWGRALRTAGVIMLVFGLHALRMKVAVMPESVTSPTPENGDVQSPQA